MTQKTKIVVKHEPFQRIRVIPIESLERIRKHVNACIEAQSLWCKDCGKEHPHVYRGKILPCCVSCCLKRLETLLFNEDEDEHSAKY